MKRFASKTFLILFLLSLFALPVTVLADSGSGGDEFTQTVNGYQITVTFDTAPSLGENPIHVRVMDAQNKPVSQADLEVSIVARQSESDDHQPAAENGMTGMDSKPTPKSSMPGMEDSMPTPSAESSMAGMDDPKPEPTAANKVPEKPDQTSDTTHDQMTRFAPGHEDGEYDGQVSITSAGDMQLRVHLTVEGDLMEADFPLHIAQSQTGSFILGGFFALNAALIAAAVILKPKPVL